MGGKSRILHSSTPASDGVAAVRVVGLRVVRRGQVVIPDLTVDVPGGQVVGLLGPSGCGKTTLMRSIVGVQVLAAGSVEVLGREAGDPDLRHRLAYMTQSSNVYADLTVKENLRYFAAILGVSRALREAEVARVAALVELQVDADVRLDRLSGGQKCRVSLAAALLGKPEMLVLDEPTVGLDPLLRRDLWAMFRRLAGDGVTILVSSHVMEEASRCDRLLLMRAGELLANTTLPGLLEVTGARDVESAFLALVERTNPRIEPAGQLLSATPRRAR